MHFNFEKKERKSYTIYFEIAIIKVESNLNTWILAEIKDLFLKYSKY